MKLTPVPRYTVPPDFEEYVEGWKTEDEPALSRLLARAEGYIDTLGAGQAIQPCDAIQCIEISYKPKHPPTGGTFKVQFEVLGVTYTSLAIPFNAEYADVMKAMEEAPGFPGNVASYPGSPTAFINSGPLPVVPIIFAFVGFAGGMTIPQAEIVENTLTGGETVVATVKQVCPGSGWNGRFNPSQLLAFGQLEALKRAVCAQAEYMNDMGPRFFVEAQYQTVKGPDFTTTGKLPKIAPKARRELAQAGLVTSMARSVP